MRISDILGMSLTNLWKRKMRTVLTVLGVVIGTASIVVMLSLGLGLKQAMLAQVGSAGGLTEILVYSDAMYGSDDLLLDDKTIELFSGMEYVENVQPQLIYSMPFQIGNYEGYMDLVGVTPEYMSQIPLGQGEYPGQNGNVPGFWCGIPAPTFGKVPVLRALVPWQQPFPCGKTHRWSWNSFSRAAV